MFQFQVKAVGYPLLHYPAAHIFCAHPYATACAFAGVGCLFYTQTCIPASEGRVRVAVAVSHFDRCGNCFGKGGARVLCWKRKKIR